METREAFSRSLEVDNLFDSLPWLLFEPSRFDDYEDKLGFKKKYLVSMQIFAGFILLSLIYYALLVVVFLFIYLVSQSLEGYSFAQIGDAIKSGILDNLNKKLLWILLQVYIICFAIHALLSLRRMGFAIVMVVLLMFGAVGLFLFANIFSLFSLNQYSEYLFGFLLGITFGLFGDVVIRYFGGKDLPVRIRILITCSIGVFGWIMATLDGFGIINGLIISGLFFLFYFRIPFVPIYAFFWKNISLEKNPFVKDEFIFFSPPGLSNKLKSIAWVQAELAMQFAQFLLTYRPLQRKLGEEIFHISLSSTCSQAFAEEIKLGKVSFPDEMKFLLPTEKWQSELTKILKGIAEVKLDPFNLNKVWQLLGQIKAFSEINQEESMSWRGIYSQTIEAWEVEIEKRYNIALKKHPEELKSNFDIFLSHAVVDKESISDELYRRLSDKGYKVWYSGKDLFIGDSLNDEISRAIYACEILIAIVSEEYLKNTWTRRELNAFGNKKSKTSILPVWHGVDQSDIEKNHALLLDGFACFSAQGLDKVVEKLEVKLNKELALP